MGKSQIFHFTKFSMVLCLFLVILKLLIQFLWFYINFRPTEEAFSFWNMFNWKKFKTYPFYKMMKITLFVQEKFEIFWIRSILIYYKRLFLSVELKRSSADYLVIQYTKTHFSHLDWVTQENILHVVVLEHML